MPWVDNNHRESGLAVGTVVVGFTLVGGAAVGMGKLVIMGSGPAVDAEVDASPDEGLGSVSPEELLRSLVTCTAGRYGWRLLGRFRPIVWEQGLLHQGKGFCCRRSVIDACKLFGAPKLLMGKTPASQDNNWPPYLGG